MAKVIKGKASQLPTIRSLTHKEFKEMYARKISEAHMMEAASAGDIVLAAEKNFARMDFFIKEVYGDPNLEELDQNVLNQLIRDTIHITVNGATDEEKN